MPATDESLLPDNILFSLYRDEEYVIKTPLFPLFNAVKIDMSSAEKIVLLTGVEVDTHYATFLYSNYDWIKGVPRAVTRYTTNPFIAPPEAQEKTLKLIIRTSAWTITKIRYPLAYYQKLSERPNVGIDATVNLKDGLRVDIVNNELLPVKELFCVWGCGENGEDFRDKYDDHYAVIDIGGRCAIDSDKDFVGTYKDKIYCHIKKCLKPS